jgi:hypothetical protein
LVLVAIGSLFDFPFTTAGIFFSFFSFVAFFFFMAFFAIVTAIATATAFVFVVATSRPPSTHSVIHGRT